MNDLDSTKPTETNQPPLGLPEAWRTIEVPEGAVAGPTSPEAVAGPTSPEAVAARFAAFEVGQANYRIRQASDARRTARMPVEPGPPDQAPVEPERTGQIPAVVESPGQDETADTGEQPPSMIGDRAPWLDDHLRNPVLIAQQCQPATPKMSMQLIDVMFTGMCRSMTFFDEARACLSIPCFPLTEGHYRVLYNVMYRLRDGGCNLFSHATLRTECYEYIARDPVACHPTPLTVFLAGVT